jgi:membrane protein
MSWLRHQIDLLKRSVQGFGRADPLIQSSSVAFFTIFALPGVLVILLNIASVLFSTGKVNDAILAQVEGSLGGDGAEYVQQVLDRADEQGGSWFDQVAGVAAILISGTMAFVALRRGLNRVWGVEIDSGRGFKEQLLVRGIALLLMAGFSFLLPLSLLMDNLMLFAIGQVLGEAPPGVVYAAVGQLISGGLMVLVLAVLYKVLPNARVCWRDVWPGALLAATLFMLGRYLVGLYITLTGIGGSFGAGRSVLVILVWMFMSALIIFLGAVHCHTVAQDGGRGIDPGRSASAVKGV